MIHDFMNTTTITRNVDMNLHAVENILISTAKRCLKIKTAKSDVAKYLRTKNGSTKNAAIKDMNCGNFLIKNIEILSTIPSEKSFTTS